MKSNGLRNRFSQDELCSAWAFHYKCLWCGKGGFDCFHHIKSPSSSNYKDGSFNKSILNSYPIHNFGCHLYNSELHKPENESRMLKEVLRILLREDYTLKERDKKFMSVYSDCYEGFTSLDKRG